MYLITTLLDHTQQALWDGGHLIPSPTDKDKQHHHGPSRLTIGPPPTRDVPFLGEGTTCCTTEFGSAVKAKEATDFMEELFREAITNKTTPITSGVVYIIATQESKVGDLEAVVARLDTHFIRLHQYPVIIYMAGYNVTEEIANRLRAAAPSSVLDLRPVDSVLTAQNKTLALWEFQTAGAPQLLSQEYEWALHICELTFLSQDVLLDPFLALQVRKQKAAIRL